MNICKVFLFALMSTFVLPFQVMCQDSLIIAFGSCSKAHLDQSYWTVIDSKQPDAWVWLGDIVYADSNIPKVLKKKYRKLDRNEHYRTFREKRPVFGVWDDHDYGKNDGGKSFSAKAESRDILYDFLDVPKKAPIRKREGAYQSYRLGDDELSVRLILLDVRYFRDELRKQEGGPNRYVQDSTATILGASQWEWLEDELRSANEDVILIGSGTQIIPIDHPYEKWADYPLERQRLFQLLAQHSNKRVVLLSGDRHLAEVSAFVVNPDLFLYEMTSSGLTHSYETGGDEVNNYRIRTSCTDKNFGTVDVRKTGDVVRVVGSIYTIDGKLFDEYEIFKN